MVVCADYGSRSSIQLSNLIDELFHVFDISVWCIFRINLRRVQNNNLNSIRSQCLQRSGKAAGLVGRLAAVGKAALLIKDFCNDIYLRFLYNGIIIKHQKTEPTYTKTSLFLCEKRRFFMARREKGVVPIIYFEKERGKSF